LDESSARRIARKHALINAYRHDGKADAGAVIGKVLGELPDLRSQTKEVFPLIKAAIDDVNQLSLDEQVAKLGAEYPEALDQLRGKKDSRKTLQDLPDAEKGKVITRFPPEPNGYPHIGHAKALILNYKYAKMYSGKFILRFDDTNPGKESIEYYDAITRGLEWLGIRPDAVKNTSDDLEKIYELAKRMIDLGHLYVCECNQETIKENRARGIECEHRRNGIQWSQDNWDNLFTSYKANEVVVRFSGNMKSLNTALRDPSMLRIIDHPHPLTGDRYRLWPTYDLASPLEDSMDGVTHALRSKEYELRDELYYKVLDALEMRKPRLIEFARLTLKGTPVSKRIHNTFIEEGWVDGWDDPRLPTLVGIQRRGIVPEAIGEFVEGMGRSKSESEPTWDLLESINRKIIDPSTKRYLFVRDPVELRVKDAPVLSVFLKHHPDDTLGERKVETRGRFYISRSDSENLKDGEIVRLMELFNLEVAKRGQTIDGTYAGDKNVHGIKKIHWVPDDAVPFKVMIPGPLFKGGARNTESMETVKGLGEPETRLLKKGERIQFVRFGFCKVDGEGVAIFTHK
jgi:glutamyl-tRNA synthetase